MTNIAGPRREPGCRCFVCSSPRQCRRRHEAGTWQGADAARRGPPSPRVCHCPLRPPTDQLAFRQASQRPAHQRLRVIRTRGRPRERPGPRSPRAALRPTRPNGLARLRCRSSPAVRHEPLFCRLLYRIRQEACPYWINEDIADLLTRTGSDPLLRSYLCAYPAGIYWFVNLADANTTEQLLSAQAAYRDPLTPAQLARLWPSGPTFGGPVTTNYDQGGSRL
jgi:hypothetical protein